MGSISNEWKVPPNRPGFIHFKMQTGNYDIVLFLECKKWALTKTVFCTYSHVPSTLEITNTECWRTQYLRTFGCGIVRSFSCDSSFYLPQNTLMENMFYIIKMRERNGTIKKQTQLIYWVPLLLVTPMNAHLCNVGTQWFSLVSFSLVKTHFYSVCTLFHSISKCQQMHEEIGENA
jgi:hypothetical protein